MVIAGGYLIFRGYRKSAGRYRETQKFMAIGDKEDIHITDDINGRRIGHFIGDITMDLREARLEAGENHLSLSSFIGDIKVTLPPGTAARVGARSLLGDIDILGRRHDGIFNSAVEKSSDYDSADRKLNLDVEVFIGDIRVN